MVYVLPSSRLSPPTPPPPPTPPRPYLFLSVPRPFPLASVNAREANENVRPDEIIHCPLGKSGDVSRSSVGEQILRELKAISKIRRLIPLLYEYPTRELN